MVYPQNPRNWGDQVTPVIFWKQSLPIFKACVCVCQCCWTGVAACPHRCGLYLCLVSRLLICVVVVVVVVIGYRIWGIQSVLLLDLQRDRSYEFNVEHPFVHLSICLFLSVC